MLGVKMGDIWEYKVNHMGNMIELAVDQVEELRSVRFVLMSCLTRFTINPDDIFIPRQEGICKTFFHMCWDTRALITDSIYLKDYSNPGIVASTMMKLGFF